MKNLSQKITDCDTLLKEQLAKMNSGSTEQEIVDAHIKIIRLRERIEVYQEMMDVDNGMYEALKYIIKWHREHDSGEGELFGLDYVTKAISAVRKAEEGK